MHGLKTFSLMAVIQPASALRSSAYPNETGVTPGLGSKMLDFIHQQSSYATDDETASGSSVSSINSAITKETEFKEAPVDEDSSGSKSFASSGNASSVSVSTILQSPEVDAADEVKHLENQMIQELDLIERKYQELKEKFAYFVGWGPEDSWRVEKSSFVMPNEHKNKKKLHQRFLQLRDDYDIVYAKANASRENAFASSTAKISLDDAVNIHPRIFVEKYGAVVIDNEASAAENVLSSFATYQVESLKTQPDDVNVYGRAATAADLQFMWNEAVKRLQIRQEEEKKAYAVEISKGQLLDEKLQVVVHRHGSIDASLSGSGEELLDTGAATGGENPFSKVLSTRAQYNWKITRIIVTGDSNNEELFDGSFTELFHNQSDLFNSGHANLNDLIHNLKGYDEAEHFHFELASTKNITLNLRLDPIRSKQAMVQKLKDVQASCAQYITYAKYQFDEFSSELKWHMELSALQEEKNIAGLKSMLVDRPRMVKFLANRQAQVGIITKVNSHKSVNVQRVHFNSILEKSRLGTVENVDLAEVEFVRNAVHNREMQDLSKQLMKKAALELRDMLNSQEESDFDKHFKNAQYVKIVYPLTIEAALGEHLQSLLYGLQASKNLNEILSTFIKASEQTILLMLPEIMYRNMRLQKFSHAQLEKSQKQSIAKDEITRHLINSKNNIVKNWTHERINRWAGHDILDEQHEYFQNFLKLVGKLEEEIRNRKEWDQVDLVDQIE